MTTDRELLELAAKAAGIEYIKWNDHQDRGRLGGWINDGRHTWWSPLADDGDALRLAVKLGMQLDCENCMAQNDSGTWFDEGIEDIDDPEAAIRRAIVRAAAEIGRSMNASR